MTATKTAIVTGAGKRVGAAMAAALLSEGWAVVAHVRKEGDDVPAGATKAVADFSTPDCADAIFAAVIARANGMTRRVERLETSIVAPREWTGPSYSM